MADHFSSQTDTSDGHLQDILAGLRKYCILLVDMITSGYGRYGGGSGTLAPTMARSAQQVHHAPPHTHTHHPKPQLHQMDAATTQHRNRTLIRAREVAGSGPNASAHRPTVARVELSHHHTAPIHATEAPPPHTHHPKPQVHQMGTATIQHRNRTLTG